MKYTSKGGGGTRGRDMKEPAGSGSAKHKGTMGSGEHTPKMKGTMGSGAGSPSAKGVMGKC